MNQPEVLQTKNHEKIIDALRTEAQTNKVFASVMLVFAVRERARYQVTIPALKYRMQKEGYNFTVEQLAKVLSFLASLSIGKLSFDAGGKVKALIDIKLTLQSVGQAAMGQIAITEQFKQARRYAPLAVPPAPKPAQEIVNKPVPKPPTEANKHKVFLSASIDGHYINFPTPMVLTADELLDLVTQMSNKTPQSERKDY